MANKEIELIDSLMGTGKTTAIIDWMSNNPLNKYMYVSPLLSEVDEGGRLHRQVKDLTFYAPNMDNMTIDDDVISHQSKSEALLSLLKLGVNISCTHSLFSNMRDEHFKLIAEHQYILVIDEEIQMIESFNAYSRSDLKWLQSMNVITVSEEDGSVEWVDNEHSQVEDVAHKYNRLKHYCDSGSLYCAKRSDTMLNVQLPTKLLESASRVIILTYLFEGNVLSAFLKLKGFNIVPFKEKIELKEVDADLVRKLLIIDNPPKRFDLGSKLSHSWYEKPDKGDIVKITNTIRSVCRSWGVDSEHVLYTFPKSRSVAGDCRSAKIKPKGFIFSKSSRPCWIAASTKATNAYSHITHMIHAYNRHPNVNVASYLHDYGYSVKADQYALSELIQWLWRGCIRNDEPMKVCILSTRMEKLLRGWLDSL